MKEIFTFMVTTDNNKLLENTNDIMEMVKSKFERIGITHIDSDKDIYFDMKDKTLYFLGQPVCTLEILEETETDKFNIYEYTKELDQGIAIRTCEETQQGEKTITKYSFGFRRNKDGKMIRLTFNVDVMTQDLSITLTIGYQKNNKAIVNIKNPQTQEIIISVPIQYEKDKPATLNLSLSN